MKAIDSPRFRRSLLLAAEIALVVAILGLLLLMWLPALIGPHPGSEWR